MQIARGKLGGPNASLDLGERVVEWCPFGGVQARHGLARLQRDDVARRRLRGIE